jgi:hypothetical protein
MDNKIVPSSASSTSSLDTTESSLLFTSPSLLSPNRPPPPPSTPNQYDLFDNPMVAAALRSMSPEEIERYKNIGEQMYGTIDFPSAKILNNPTDPTAKLSQQAQSGGNNEMDVMIDALAYVTEQLKSGIMARDLDDNERAVLSACIGEDWETTWYLQFSQSLY